MRGYTGPSSPHFSILQATEKRGLGTKLDGSYSNGKLSYSDRKLSYSDRKLSYSDRKLSYTTGSYKNEVSYNLHCLRCELPCMLTNNNKDQSN